MGKAIDFIVKCMDNVPRYFLGVAFSIILGIALVCKSMYDFSDCPYFTYINKYDVICLALVAGLVYLSYRYRQLLSSRTGFIIYTIMFIVGVGMYSYLVPTIPYSDAGAVYRGAISLAQSDISLLLSDGYWNDFPGNIYLTVFWAILIKPFPKVMATFCVVNALFVLLIAQFSCMLAKEFGIKNYRLVYPALLFFMPLALYINWVYYDLPLTFLTVLAIYIYKKYDNLWAPYIVLFFARYFRKSSWVIFIAITMCYFIDHRSELSSAKKCIRTVVVVVLGFAVLYYGIKLLKLGIRTAIFDENYVSYPGWNQIYIGLNEEKLGFMDHSFSYDRSLNDIIERLKEYGLVRTLKILVKKTFWLWSQGTYMVQRYAFGLDTVVEADKFSYHTVLTNHLLYDAQPLRKLINSFCRSQYLIAFALFIRALVDKQNAKVFRVIIFIFMGIFLVMLVYELKSRYILSLAPLMVIMAVQFFDRKNREISVKND